jgi:hypothetical protein
VSESPPAGPAHGAGHSIAFDANVLLGPLPRRPPGAPEDATALEAVLDAYTASSAPW